VFAGVLAIALSLIVNQQRQSTKHVAERRSDGPPPQ
jgi:hypothetical protein